MRLLLAAFLAALAPLLWAATADAACRAAAEPELVVRRGVDMPTKQDESKDLFEVTRLGHQGRPDMQSEFYSLGATINSVKATVAVHVQPFQTARGLCAAVERVTVTVSQQPRATYIAREAAADPCLRGEIATHERRHLGLDDRLVDELVIPMIRAALSGTVAQLEPIEERDRAGLQARIQQLAQRLVRRIPLEAIGQARLARHLAEVDTRSEYDRFSRVCKGAARAVIAGATTRDPGALGLVGSSSR